MHVKVKREYQGLINELTKSVEAHFSSEVAYFLLGSVGRGEDLPGVSDMDTVVILRRNLIDEDEAWEKDIKAQFMFQNIRCCLFLILAVSVIVNHA